MIEQEELPTCNSRRSLELRAEMEAIENAIAGQPSRLYTIICDTVGYCDSPEEEREVLGRLAAVREARLQLLLEGSEEYKQARQAFHEHLWTDPRSTQLKRKGIYNLHASIETSCNTLKSAKEALADARRNNNDQGTIDTLETRINGLITRIGELDQKFSYVQHWTPVWIEAM
jgi:hypothetical protein